MYFVLCDLTKFANVTCSEDLLPAKRRPFGSSGLQTVVSSLD